MEAPITSNQETMEAIDDNEDRMDNISDDKPATFINENLWKKFAFKFLAYVFYSIALSISIIGTVIDWSWPKFFTCIQVIILPLIWQTLDAQARNKEIQEKLKTDAEKAVLEAELQAAKDANNELEVQIAIVKQQLDDKASTLIANQAAVNKTNEV